MNIMEFYYSIQHLHYSEDKLCSFTSLRIVKYGLRIIEKYIDLIFLSIKIMI